MVIEKFMNSSGNIVYNSSNEFIPTLIETGHWEAWVWDQLSIEIKRRAPKKIVDAIQKCDAYQVKELLGLSDLHIDAIDDVLADMRSASGPVAVRERRRQEVILRFISYIDTLNEQSCELNEREA